MDEVVIESFIQHCDEMMIAEEGKIFDVIKRVINNTINKRLKNRESKKDTTNDSKNYITFTNQKVSGSQFDNLVKVEAFCAEGMKDPDSDNTCKFFVEHISKWDGHPNQIHFFHCTGKDLNSYYHLTGDNQYPNDLGIFFIDYSNFDKKFKASEYKGNFRYFSDVVDNNARREIRKGNKHYEGYHSIYGDDWFYSTI